MDLFFLKRKIYIIICITFFLVPSAQFMSAWWIVHLLLLPKLFSFTLGFWFSGDGSVSSPPQFPLSTFSRRLTPATFVCEELEAKGVHFTFFSSSISLLNVCILGALIGKTLLLLSSPIGNCCRTVNSA